MPVSSNILVLGAEGTGKSLLLKRLSFLATKLDEEFDFNIPSTVPTVGTDIVKIKVDRNEFVLREVGGTMAPLWKNYYSDSKAIIYLIDKSNQFQVSNACIMLYTALSHPTNKDKKVLIIFNKIDFDSSFSLDQYMKIFRLGDLKRKCGENVTIAEISCVVKFGFDKIFEWLNNI